MDVKSLSLFMKTSVAYECTVCKLYFGTESQLVSHHKRSHSKRLKVSLNPELNLTEDKDFNSSMKEASPTNSSSGDNHDPPEEQSIVKLETREANTIPNEKKKMKPNTSQDNVSTNVSSNDNLKHTPTLKRQTEIPQMLENNGKSPTKTCLQTNTQNIYEGLHSKRVKTETNSANENEKESFPEGGNLEAVNTNRCSESMKDTIEKGQYGYLLESGFQRFSMEELKKFAVQVVALFKLDESHQNLSCRVEGQSSEATGFQNLKTGGMIITSNISRDQFPLNTDTSSAGVTLDDPNKSCYKCGEFGHFAWGCTKPRNREIQPRRKRRGRKKKKEQ